MHYFEYASNISSIFNILEETKKYEQYLDEDKYSLLIVHTTLAAQKNGRRGSVGEIRNRIWEINLQMKDIIDKMGNQTMFIAIGNKGDDFEISHSWTRNGYDIIDEILDEDAFKYIKKVGMIDPFVYEKEI